MDANNFGDLGCGKSGTAGTVLLGIKSMDRTIALSLIFPSGVTRPVSVTYTAYLPRSISA